MSVPQHIGMDLNNVMYQEKQRLRCLQVNQLSKAVCDTIIATHPNYTPKVLHYLSCGACWGLENANLDSNASIGVLLSSCYAPKVSASLMDFYLFYFSKYRGLITQLESIQAHYQIQMGLHEC